MRALFTLLLGLAACASPSDRLADGLAVSPPTSDTAFRVLGAAQDAGLPHIGCVCERCEAVRAQGLQQYVSCVAIEDGEQWWMLDASPDLPAQIHAQGSMPAGIFLTHAHIGHYTGLMYLGREALGAQGMPVWCSPRMAAFLRSNGPWSQLVELGQIELHEFQTQVPVQLSEQLQITAVQVPHRDEFSDTHGFWVERTDRPGAVLYLPDIDQWDRWQRQIEDYLQPGAHLLLDGTFWSGAELPHRDLDEIPHPLVSHSIERLAAPLANSEARVSFIHLNHSNPLWDRRGPEAQRLRAAGFGLAEQGARTPF